MKKEISNREDVILLVNTFYQKVLTNNILAPIFQDIMKVDWSTHLPKMYDFWSSILLDTHSYNGNPMSVHLQMAGIVPLGEQEFSEWLSLFNQTLDDLFSGDKCNEAKLRAANIARLMQYKIARGF